MSQDRVGAPPVAGRAHRHEMIYAGERRYAERLTDFLADLIPGYTELTDPAERTRARVRHANGVRAAWQAEINLAFGAEGCTAEQIVVLSGDHAAPPDLRDWSAPVPLLLVDSFYEPATELARPVAVEPGEIFWLKPTDELGYLLSLDVLDIVVLVDHVAGPGHATEGQSW